MWRWQSQTFPTEVHPAPAGLEVFLFCCFLCRSPGGLQGGVDSCPREGCACAAPRPSCVPLLPPSAFPVPPSAAVMATGVSRATAEPLLIGGCQAGRMGLGCPEMLPGEQDQEDGMGGRQPPDLTFPLQPPWPGCREAQGRGTQLRLGGVPVFSWWAPQPGCLPGSAGDRVTPGTQPSTQGHFKGPLMAACSMGKQLRAGPRGAESSTETLLGRGCCGETALEETQGGKWGLNSTSGLFIPEITHVLSSPPGNSGVSVALGQVGRPGQGRGSVSRGDQSSCALGNSLDQQT